MNPDLKRIGHSIIIPSSIKVATDPLNPLKKYYKVQPKEYSDNTALIPRD